MRKKVTVIALAVVAVILAAWLRPFSSPRAPAVPPVYTGPIVAKVGGTPIYLDQVRSRYSSMASVHGSDVKPAALKREIMDSFVQEVAIAKGAVEQGVGMAPAELALYISGVTGRFQNDPKTMADFLKASDATWPQLEMRIYLNFLASRLYLTITQTATVTDQEVRDYFAKHHSDFAVPAGSTPQVAFEAVKPEIAQTLLKQKQDQTWTTWLGQQTERYPLEIVMEDWWKQTKKTTQPSPRPEETPKASPSPSPSAG